MDFSTFYKEYDEALRWESNDFTTVQGINGPFYSAEHSGSLPWVPLCYLYNLIQRSKTAVWNLNRFTVQSMNSLPTKKSYNKNK